MFKIKERAINANNEPYIIAELSANHNGSIEQAKQSIKAAKNSGAHAIKLQTYTADTMTINSDKPDFLIKGGLWSGYKLYDLYNEAHTPYEWHQELFNYANELDITIFSTPFDESAVELLEELDVPAYKIASFELTDTPLIKLVASKKKPLLMSTGMASENEIIEAIDTARNAGCIDILLFHCISSYPTPIEHSNLRKIINLKNKFNVEVGLSDHTIGNVAAITAVALGATAIEKHFTLARKNGGPDSAFSIEPDEFKNLVNSTREAWLSLGNTDFSRPTTENENICFRRSIYFVRDLKKDQIITNEDIRRIRPGYGIQPKFYNDILGMKVIHDVYRGEPVSWKNIKKADQTS